MTRIFPFAAAVLLPGACATPGPVFTSELDVHDALTEIQNARFTAHLSNDVEASDSHWEREFVSGLSRHHRLNLIRLKRDVGH